MAIKLPRRFFMPQSEAEAKKGLLTASPEFLGGFGEAVWGNLLAKAGFRCVWLSAIEQGGAPMAVGWDDKLILPDFDAKCDGRGIYIDAKVKSQSIRYRKAGNQERHGINYQNYRSYSRMAAESGQPCALGLIELNRQREDGGIVWSGSLLFGTLSSLGEPRAENPEIPPKVYWPRKRFGDLDGGLTATELFEIACGQSRRNYTLELKQAVFPFKQTALF